MEKNGFRSKIYAKIDELPSLPTVIHQLMSIMEDPGTSAQDVRDIIAHDAPLTAKILKVANSAYYGFPQEISELERAIALLGFNMVKTLAISAGIINSIPNTTEQTGFSVQQLWIHSLAVGTGMKMFAEKCNRRENAESLFIAGLLHDIGKMVLNRFFPDHFARVLKNNEKDEGLFFYQKERETIGIDHGEIGAMLLERWKLPYDITDTVAFHHKPNIPEYINGSNVSILRLADAISHELDMGDSASTCPPPAEKADMEQSDINSAILEEIKQGLDEKREGIIAFFEAMM